MKGEEFKPSKLYRDLGLDAQEKIDITRPLHENFAGESAENQAWFEKVEKAVAESPQDVEREYPQKGNWLEAFSAVLFLIQASIFDPRFANALGRSQSQRIRDRVSALRHEVDDLQLGLGDERRRTRGVEVSEERKQELLKKIQGIL